MPDYIPPADDPFSRWVNPFADYVLAHAAALNVTAADAQEMDAARQAFDQSFDAYNTGVTSLASLLQSKNDNRDTAESKARALVRRLQADPKITAAQKQSMQITVSDGIRSRAATPTTKPVAQVAGGQRLQHTLNFRDETTPGSKARPAGVIGAEVWCGITAAGAPVPTNPGQFKLLAIDSTPHLVEHDPADAGKTASYILRWQNTGGEKGPWSDTVSGTIAG